jgi:hypothetical protein
VAARTGSPAISPTCSTRGSRRCSAWSRIPPRPGVTAGKAGGVCGEPGGDPLLALVLTVST